MIRYGLRGTERDFFHFPGGHCDMVIDRQQEMLFVLLEQTRLRNAGTFGGPLELLVHEAMAN